MIHSPAEMIGGVADDGHQIAVAARLRPENAEAVLGVVEGDPLDEAGEHFLSRWLRTGSHADCQNIPSYLSARSCDIASRTYVSNCDPWTTVLPKPVAIGEPIYVRT